MTNIQNSVAPSGATGIQIVNKTALSSQNTLREGGFVFLRVLDGPSANSKTYTVSFAGSRFSVQSKIPLKPGDAFRARIRINNGKVELVSEMAKPTSELSTYTKSNVVTHITSPQQLTNLFLSLGIPCDNVSMTLVRFLQLSGLSYDTRLLNKARTIAAKFPGHEEQAAEVALYLAEKGIEPDMDSVMELLNTMAGANFEDNGDQSANEQQTHDNHSESNGNAADSQNTSDSQNAADSHVYAAGDTYSYEDESFISNLYNDEIDAIFSLEPGVLTVANQIKSGNLHWIILPFECGPISNLEELNATKNKTTRKTGSLRILCDLAQKSVKQINISVFSRDKSDFFALYSGKPWKIQFASEPPLSVLEQEKCESRLKEQFAVLDKAELAACIVEYSQTLVDGGLFSGSRWLESVSGDA